MCKSQMSCLVIHPDGICPWKNECNCNNISASFNSSINTLASKNDAIDNFVAKEVPCEDWQESEREAWKNFCNTDNFSAPPYEHNTITGYWLSRMQKRIDEAKMEQIRETECECIENVKHHIKLERTKLRTMLEKLKKELKDDCNICISCESGMSNCDQRDGDRQYNQALQDIINSLQETDE